MAHLDVLVPVSNTAGRNGDIAVPTLSRATEPTEVRLNFLSFAIIDWRARTIALFFAPYSQTTQFRGLKDSLIY
jgi:hypothetical protein